MRDTWKKVLGNKCKDHLALGEPALSPGTKLTLGRRGFCFLPAHQLSSQVKIYTNMCFLHSPPKTETISKSGFGQRPSDWTRPGHFLGSQEEYINPGHSSPLRGRDWVNPLWLPEVKPPYTPKGRDLTLQRDALMTWGGGLCVWSRKSLQVPPFQPEGPEHAETCLPHP